MAYGKSIELFLVNGSADSLITEYIDALDDEYFLDEEETETL